MCFWLRWGARPRETPLWATRKKRESRGGLFFLGASAARGTPWRAARHTRALRLVGAAAVPARAGATAARHVGGRRRKGSEKRRPRGWECQCRKDRCGEGSRRTARLFPRRHCRRHCRRRGRSLPACLPPDRDVVFGTLGMWQRETPKRKGWVCIPDRGGRLYVRLTVPLMPLRPASAARAPIRCRRCAVSCQWRRCVWKARTGKKKHALKGDRDHGRPSLSFTVSPWPSSCPFSSRAAHPRRGAHICALSSRGHVPAAACSQ